MKVDKRKDWLCDQKPLLHSRIGLFRAFRVVSHALSSFVAYCSFEGTKQDALGPLGTGFVSLLDGIIRFITVLTVAEADGNRKASEYGVTTFYGVFSFLRVVLLGAQCRMNDPARLRKYVSLTSGVDGFLVSAMGVRNFLNILDDWSLKPTSANVSRGGLVFFQILALPQTILQMVLSKQKDPNLTTVWGVIFGVREIGMVISAGSQFVLASVIKDEQEDGSKSYCDKRKKLLKERQMP
ncbi:hypothetical protein KKHLCK_00140 [Candidatus Electrothrix laxa]